MVYSIMEQVQFKMYMFAVSNKTGVQLQAVFRLKPVISPDITEGALMNPIGAEFGDVWCTKSP